ncbi:MAG: radical SAM protein, partial [Candidatus Altiarchaeota archaeon]|nr:radical SAM protein [Candidatus Altiarchaeota archaeon]
MRVLILNPPGRETYLRDQYCGGTTTKANYYWHPLDLLLQSGVIASEHEIKIIDAIAENLDYAETMRQIDSFHPEAIYSLSSIISLEEDLAFFRDCKKRYDCKIIVSGDVFYFNPDEMIWEECIDAILLNYTSDEILDYLRGEKKVGNMTYKEKGKITKGERVNCRNFSYPVPTHELFPMKKYNMPFMKTSPIMSIISSTGCPFKCCFCPLSQVDYKERDLSNLFEELDYLHKIGVRDLEFRDPTFAVNIERAKRICQKMKDYSFNWFCSNRVDRIDEELLVLMKESGCHLMTLGVESGSEKMLKEGNKNIDKKGIKEIFHLCKKHKIKTLAHFIYGFPNDSLETVKETMDFALELESDYISLNMYAPRHGSIWGGEYLTKYKKEGK